MAKEISKEGKARSNLLINSKLAMI